MAFRKLSDPFSLKGTSFMDSHVGSHVGAQKAGRSPLLNSKLCLFLLALLSLSPIIALVALKWQMSHTHMLTHPFSFHEPNNMKYHLHKTIVSPETNTFYFTDAHDEHVKIKWSDALKLWQSDREFMEAFISALQEAPFETYYLEFEPVGGGGEGPFRFAVTDAPNLRDLSVDLTTFASYFEKDGGVAPQDASSDGKAPQDASLDAVSVSRGPSKVISFSNLSGSAVLVVPHHAHALSAFTTDHDYAQISWFVRSADSGIRGQQRQLWREVGREIERRLEKEEDVWVSTDGEGVSYLHVRVENSPKYYKHEAFKRPPRHTHTTSN